MFHHSRLSHTRRRSRLNVSTKTARYPRPAIGPGVRAGGFARRAVRCEAGFSAGRSDVISPAVLVDAGRHEAVPTPSDRPMPSSTSTETVVRLAAARKRLKTAGWGPDYPGAAMHPQGEASAIRAALWSRYVTGRKRGGWIPGRDAPGG